jgi:hypothetical protein
MYFKANFPVRMIRNRKQENRREHRLQNSICACDAFQSAQWGKSNTGVMQNLVRNAIREEADAIAQPEL